MTDLIMIAVVVAFFALSALLVRALGGVVEEAGAEREPEYADLAEATPEQATGGQPRNPLADQPR